MAFSPWKMGIVRLHANATSCTVLWQCHLHHGVPHRSVCGIHCRAAYQGAWPQGLRPSLRGTSQLPTPALACQFLVHACRVTLSLNIISVVVWREVGWVAYKWFTYIPESWILSMFSTSSPFPLLSSRLQGTSILS